MNKKIKRAFKTVTVAALIICISGILRFSLSPVSYAHWAVHDRKELFGKTDTLIIGDSLPLYGVQPSVLDKNTGCTSFNTSTPSQFMDQTYYLLLDFLNTENIRTVFLGIDYYNFLTEAEDENDTSSRIVFGRMKDPKTKAAFAKEFMQSDKAWNWIFTERNSIGNFSKIPGNVRAKLSYEYRNYLPLSDKRYLLEGGTYYFDKGYVRTDSSDEEYIEGIHDMKNMSEKNISRFVRIITLCADRGVELYIFNTPMKKSFVEATANYSLFYDRVCRIAAEHNCRYYDFNFYPERDSLSDDTCFANDTHLNYQGSLIFMEWLCSEYERG